MSADDLAERLARFLGPRLGADVVRVVGLERSTEGFSVVRGAGGARLTGILDWEMVHVGDPLEDLGWLVSPLWFGGTPYASAMLPPEDLAAAYAAAAGRLVDAERLRFWAVLSVVKMAAIMLTGIRAFADGRTPDLRMAIFDHQLPFLYVLLGALRGWLGGG